MVVGPKAWWLVRRTISLSFAGFIHLPSTKPLALFDQVKIFEKYLIEQAPIDNKAIIQNTMETLSIPRWTLNKKMRICDLDRKKYI